MAIHLYTYLTRVCFVCTEAGHRLQNAVERLLDMITDTTHQLHEAQRTQKELISSLAQRTEEVCLNASPF